MDKEPLLFKIAHLSDLHFSKISFHPAQFLSKQWIGNLNLLFNRARIYKNTQPLTLVNFLHDHGISHVFISGDVSTTSSRQEFAMAQRFVESLQQKGMLVFTIPGNHDNYTARAYKKKLFYEYFPNTPGLSDFQLSQHGVDATCLGDHWWLVRIDSTYPTAVQYSTGRYTQLHDEHLRTLLNKIPSQDSILVMNHFPLFHHESSRRVLHGADLLRKTLSLYPNIKLYLHGHTHRHCVADLRGNHLPIILDSGSASHAERGSWNALEIYPSRCVIDRFIPDRRLSWKLEKTFSYTW